VSVALVIQDAMRMRRIMSPVAYLALSYFTTLSHKQYDFRKVDDLYRLYRWL
jgi:hypothetical protein